MTTDINKELNHVKMVVERIEKGHIDVTPMYEDWLGTGLALASLGEEARNLFHRISMQNPGYSKEECDQKFDNCLSSGRGLVTIGTFMDIAKRHGVDISMPKGRPIKTQKQKEEETQNKMQALQNALEGFGKLRFNTWKQRTEILEEEHWSPVNDRLLHTYYCRVKSLGINCSERDVKAMLLNRDFVKDYDPVRSWLESLPEWNPETDPDYIREFYIGHIIFKDPENIEFYDMVFRKWHLCNVALWLGLIDENPIMPTLCGEQYLGKTHFAKNVLPPELRDYLYCANPSARVDKDFSISLSEFALVFLDEFSFGTNAKSDAYKYIITSGKSNERDAYAQFREQRNRKAGIIAATNYKRFIKDPEGNRRYPGIDVAGTVNTNEHPLPYEGAYAQAMYLLKNGVNPKPTREESQLITEHNIDYMELDNCEEALRLFFCFPEDQAEGTIMAVSSGQIQQILSSRGFGKGFTTVEIGRAMKRIGFKSKKSGTMKYIVKELEQKTIIEQSKQEAIRIMSQDNDNNTSSSATVSTSKENDFPF